MSGSCYLDNASNVEIGVECQTFVIVIFFNCGQFLQFGAHSRYYKVALTQKRSFLVVCTMYFQIILSCRLKTSRETFNAKVIIWHPGEMTWMADHHQKLSTFRQNFTNFSLGEKDHLMRRASVFSPRESYHL